MGRVRTTDFANGTTNENYTASGGFAMLYPS